MAIGGLFALFDDIALTLDDVASPSKMTAKLVDVSSATEDVKDMRHRSGLNVVWSVAKGSLKNKAIVIPAALGLGFMAPATLLPLKVLCAIYLCLEGAERVLQAVWPHDQISGHNAAPAPPADPLLQQKEKIKKAIRTDLVLAAEVAIVTLAGISASPLLVQAAVLTTLGFGMTAGIYGLVASLIYLDHMGCNASVAKGAGPLQQAMGRQMHKAIPKIIKTFSVVGTMAMLAVGGGILTHSFPATGLAFQVSVGFLSGLTLVPVKTVLETSLQSDRFRKVISNGQSVWHRLKKSRESPANRETLDRPSLIIDAGGITGDPSPLRNSGSIATKFQNSAMPQVTIEIAKTSIFKKAAPLPPGHGVVRPHVCGQKKCATAM